MLDISNSDPEEGTEGKYIKFTSDTTEGAVTAFETQAAVQWDLDSRRKGLTGPHEIQQGWGQALPWQGRALQGCRLGPEGPGSSSGGWPWTILSAQRSSDPYIRISSEIATKMVGLEPLPTGRCHGTGAVSARRKDDFEGTQQQPANVGFQKHRTGSGLE